MKVYVAPKNNYTKLSLIQIESKLNHWQECIFAFIALILLN